MVLIALKKRHFKEIQEQHLLPAAWIVYLAFCELLLLKLLCIQEIKINIQQDLSHGGEKCLEALISESH